MNPEQSAFSFLTQMMEHHQTYVLFILICSDPLGGAFFDSFNKEDGSSSDNRFFDVFAPGRDFFYCVNKKWKLIKHVSFPISSPPFFSKDDGTSSKRLLFLFF